jgi:prepilin-type N-terminal cleavage/methylation domain-containing protein
MSSRAASHEDGVTLVELLVAVSILGVLTVALASALFFGFRSTRDMHTSLDQSNAEQIVSSYVAKDVQAADSVRVGVTSACGGQLAALETTTRTDPIATASDVTVAYRLTGSSLVRQVCGPSPATQTIARNITAFTASGSDPMSIDASTAPSSEVGAYSFSFEVRRRQT